MSTTSTNDESRITTTTTHRLQHSTIRLEPGPAGTIAAIRHDDGELDFAGPLAAATVNAICEVSR